ncbi:MAG: 3-oxoacyl-[acyl-carrier-protein] reductase [Coriobacteriia bacterium]
MSRLSNKVALVTGASSGIGARIALQLAGEGAAVAVNYYPGMEADAEGVVADIESAGGIAAAFPADVTVSERCEALVAAVLEKFGALDVLVNNAGITRDGLIVRMSDADWQAVISTNLTGVFFCTRAAGKVMMKARTGAIVNVASVIGLVGNAGQANYAAAKAGVIGLTKSTARELASRGVRANAVAPGFIETAMTAKLPENVREAAKQTISMRTFGTPDDVAMAVAFLASDEAGYITGQTLAIDGGMTFT